MEELQTAVSNHTEATQAAQAEQEARKMKQAVREYRNSSRPLEGARLQEEIVRFGASKHPFPRTEDLEGEFSVAAVKQVRRKGLQFPVAGLPKGEEKDEDVSPDDLLEQLNKMLEEDFVPDGLDAESMPMPGAPRLACTASLIPEPLFMSKTQQPSARLQRQRSRESILHERKLTLAQMEANSSDLSPFEMKPTSDEVRSQEVTEEMLIAFQNKYKLGCVKRKNMETIRGEEEQNVWEEVYSSRRQVLLR